MAVRVYPSGRNIPQRVLDRGGAGFNVKAYGAKGDGATDDAAAMNAAISAANSAGGGEVFIPGGTYVVGTTLILYSNVHLRGAGIEASVLKLKAATNADLVQGQNFATLTGTNSQGGIYNWSLQDLTLDGNQAAQTGGTSWCLRVYGYGYIVNNLRVRGGYSGGVYSEWGTYGGAPAAGDSMECQWSNFKIHDCAAGMTGLEFRGPHDSQFVNGVVYNCSGLGFHLADGAAYGAGGSHLVGCHCWGGATTAFAIDSVTTMLTNCQAEGASVAQIALNTDNAQINGGMVFAPSAVGAHGITIGTSGHKSVNTTLNGPFINWPSGQNGTSYCINNVNEDQSAGYALVVNNSGAALNTGFGANGVVNLYGPGSYRNLIKTNVGTGMVTFFGWACGNTVNGGAVATGGTINPANTSAVRVAPAAAVTGVILDNSNAIDGQDLALVNQAAFSITFAAQATSHVRGGTAVVIPANGGKRFVYIAADGLWSPL